MYIYIYIYIYIYTHTHTHTRTLSYLSFLFIGSHICNKITLINLTVSYKTKQLNTTKTVRLMAL